jgi:leader peptidase (prepilin peptidase)/N-methyltransferase
MELNELPLAVFWILLGFLLGSFANVCIHRLPRGKSVVAPRSHCPHCRRTIPWHQNIPLLSYALLRGRCGGCGWRIPWRYPAVEFVTGALVAAMFLLFRAEPASLVLGTLLTFVLVVMSAIDCRYFIIPDVLSIGLLAVGLVGAAFNPGLGEVPRDRVIASLVGASAGYVLLLALSIVGRWVWKKEAMGGGDVKLMAGVGAFVGWEGVGATMLIASLSGTLVALVQMARRRITRRSYLPFGPFLAVGAWVAWTARSWVLSLFRFS